MGDKNDLQKKNHKTLVGMKKICFRDEPNQYREQISTVINEVKNIDSLAYSYSIQYILSFYDYIIVHCVFLT